MLSDPSIRLKLTVGDRFCRFSKISWWEMGFLSFQLNFSYLWPAGIFYFLIIIHIARLTFEKILKSLKISNGNFPFPQLYPAFFLKFSFSGSPHWPFYWKTHPDQILHFSQGTFFPFGLKWKPISRRHVMNSVKTFSPKITTMRSSFMKTIYIFDIFYHLRAVNDSKSEVC